MKLRTLPASLASIATATALALSVGAGLQRGAAVLVCLSVVLTLAGHLLPAIVRGRASTAQAIGLVVWSGCMAFTCYGHAQFFVNGLGMASEARAAAVTEPSASNARDLTTLARERTRVTRELAEVTANRCADGCATWRARMAADAAQVASIDTEAADRRRYEAAMDDWQKDRAEAKADPMRALGVSPLTVGMVGAVVLEAVACFCWAVALPVAPESIVTASPFEVAPVSLPVTESAPPVTRAASRRRVVTPGPEPEPAPMVSAEVEAESDVERMRAGIEAGVTRGTVAEIRAFLGVGTAKAQAIRKQLDF